MGQVPRLCSVNIYITSRPSSCLPSLLHFWSFGTFFIINNRTKITCDYFYFFFFTCVCIFVVIHGTRVRFEPRSSTILIFCRVHVIIYYSRYTILYSAITNKSNMRIFSFRLYEPLITKTNYSPHAVTILYDFYFITFRIIIKLFKLEQYNWYRNQIKCTVHT